MILSLFILCVLLFGRFNELSAGFDFFIRYSRLKSNVVNFLVYLIYLRDSYFVVIKYLRFE